MQGYSVVYIRKELYEKIQTTLSSLHRLLLKFSMHST